MSLFKKTDQKNDNDRRDFSNVQSGGSSTASTKTESPAGSRTYTVMRRDTLSRIADLIYGDSKQWRKIFDANRDVIEDPDLIFPGQVLRIP